ncbi:MAG: hypothetical protein ACI9ES_000197 [Oceanospirillaceae bacterium]|jgi:hypothetical protein
MKKTIFSLALSAIFCSYSFAQCVDFDAKSELASRFKTKQGVVLDTKTNLTWQRCSVGATWSSDNSCHGEVEYMNLIAATEMSLSLEGGWRVPNIDELYSIAELNCSNPSINSEVFPNVTQMSEGAPHWSSSKIEDLPMLFYFIDFWDARADGHTANFSLAVRLVRDN